jgi:hypothetical protein
MPHVFHVSTLTNARKPFLVCVTSNDIHMCRPKAFRQPSQTSSIWTP